MILGKINDLLRNKLLVPLSFNNSQSKFMYAQTLTTLHDIATLNKIKVSSELAMSFL